MVNCSVKPSVKVVIYPFKGRKSFAKCLLRINGISIGGILIKKGQREIYVKYPKVLQFNPEYRDFLSNHIISTFLNNQSRN